MTIAPYSPVDARGTFAIGEDEVHVWRVGLDVCRLERRSLYAALAADERARAASFRFREECRRFVTARGRLRVILGRYLGRRPADVWFRYGPHGKPALVADPGGPALRFNVSHADGVALYAISRSRELGIDLERVLPRRMDERLAELLFGAHEVARLRRLAPPERAREFFRCWTRHEACLKAQGGALSMVLPLADGPRPWGELARGGCAQGRDLAPARWLLRELDLGRDFAATLVVESPPCRVRGFLWDDAVGCSVRSGADAPWYGPVSMAMCPLERSHTRWVAIAVNTAATMRQVGIAAP